MGGPPPLTLQDRIKFFQTDTGSAQRAKAVDEVRRLETLIEAEKAKLQREGATLFADGTIDWGQTAQTVIYDTTAQAQGLTQLYFGGGKIYSNVNRVTLFDTRDMVSHFGGKGWAIYVMSPEANIHASTHSVGHRHHSSLLAGADVAGAGEMRVLAGQLMHISNKSGHYMPSAAHLLQVLHVLQKRTVSLYATKVKFHTNLGATEFTGVVSFIQHLQKNGLEFDYEYAKMVAYLDALTYPVFAPLAALNGWCLGEPADFQPGAPAHGGRGIVNIANRTQVSHRDVRKWLKQQNRALPSRVQSGALR